ncbi:MAG: cytochrome c3 family protein [Burkholderiales bacterium]|jgi:nitrate/TMAO reductase-like tetraheme cytochrome c subunit|nr:cytochrome c3 family protein [Burkholderiales bacterium]MCA3226082.1 cytochrome c3 family protein [Burkholderiales bacterium]MCE2646484.1 cytochrome c3 family protein [Burkholderiaceae bacterium]
MRPLLILALFLAAALGTADPAAAQAGPNDACLMCHSDLSAKGSTGKVIGVDKAKFGASAHGGFVKCVDCHTDTAVDKLPHAPKLEPVACQSCHAQAVAEYQGTPHAKPGPAGKTAVADCASCHGAAHEVLKSTQTASLTHRLNIPTTCGSCHGSQPVAQQAAMPGGNVQAKYHDSIHGQLLKGQGGYSEQAPNCVSCHGAHGILPKGDEKSRVARANIVDTCGGCHQREKIVFDKGAHGKLRQAGITAGPNCADCHGSHAIPASTQSDWQVATIDQCGSCHSDLLKSYHLTYHGKVTNLGFSQMATCASCHGAHDVRPASDPLSPTHKDNIVAMCGNCHQNSSVQFASWDPHPQPANRERSITLYYTSIFMNVLLAGVFAFFGLHTLLWAYRSFRVVQERRRKGGGHG